MCQLAFHLTSVFPGNESTFVCRVSISNGIWMFCYLPRTHIQVNLLLQFSIKYSVVDSEVIPCCALGLGNTG